LSWYQWHLATGSILRHAGTVTTTDVARRTELGAFLRSRRERITPEQVGLPSAGRRRTPGLRREEVASVAGVGVTWYTWLEQGRDINPSPQVLEAIARCLLLDPHERTHLYRLAGSPDPDHDDASAVLPPTVGPLLDQLEPMPAAVVNARYDLLAYNRPYRLLIADIDEIPGSDRNMMWLVCTHPAWKAALLDRDETLPRMVANFRTNMAEHVGEPAWACLLSRLRTASPEFAALWERHDVASPERFTKRLLSPRVGALRLESTSLWLDRRLGTRIITYVPMDAESRERLEALPLVAVAAAS
jgi:transcriptional regulator with XRE-family HTH domain